MAIGELEFKPYKNRPTWNYMYATKYRSGIDPKIIPIRQITSKLNKIPHFLSHC